MIVKFISGYTVKYYITKIVFPTFQHSKNPGSVGEIAKPTDEHIYTLLHPAEK